MGQGHRAGALAQRAPGCLVQGWITWATSSQQASQELGQHQQGRIRPDFIQRAQESHSTEGQNCCRAQWGCASPGMLGKLLSH